MTLMRRLDIFFLIQEKPDNLRGQDKNEHISVDAQLVTSDLLKIFS